MTEEVLTNPAAADRLRELLRQPTTEDAPQNTRVSRTPTERWHQVLAEPDESDRPHDPPEAAA